MSRTENLAPVILILGALYFYYVLDKLPQLFMWALVLLAVLSWQYHSFHDERKRAYNLHNELTQAKIDWYHSQIRINNNKIFPETPQIKKRRKT